MNHLGDTNKMVGEDHIRDATKMVSDTPRTDAKRGFHDLDTAVDVEFSEQLERELNAANAKIKRLEEALDLVRPTCLFVHHSKKHQHKYNEPCPVVELIEKAKEAKP